MCAHLRLADYLLTPVQRCPRYLLLLKDLLNSTDHDDPEWEKLQEARGLIEKSKPADPLFRHVYD